MTQPKEKLITLEETKLENGRLWQRVDVARLQREQRLQMLFKEEEEEPPATKAN